MNLIDSAWQRVELMRSQYRDQIDRGVEPVFVKLQNVADYYYNGTPQEHWDIDQHFPNLAPCWPVFIAAWRTPRTYNNNGRLLPFPNPSADTVATVVAVEVTTDLRPLRWVLNVTLEQRYTPSPGDMRAVGGAWIPVDSTGRYYDVADASQQEQALTEYLTKAARFFERSLGLPENLRRPWSWVKPFPMTALGINNGRLTLAENDDQQRALVSGIWSALRPALLGLCFAHLRNATTIIDEVAPALRKRRRERGHAPINRWYTLEIGPIKTVLKSARQADGSPARSLQQALTICRGHFKTFDEHGLFGRIKGTFWWPMHVRGSSKAGAINKDYSIRAS
jgi:hypothetical protein